MSQRDIGVSQLKSRMRVAVEREQAAGGERVGRQCMVEILTGWVAIDLDGDARPRGSGKHHRPVRHYTGTRSGDAAARVREDADVRLLDGAQQTIGLVVRAAQLRMRRRKDQLEPRRFVGREVK